MLLGKINPIGELHLDPENYNYLKRCHAVTSKYSDSGHLAGPMWELGSCVYGVSIPYIDSYRT